MKTGLRTAMIAAIFLAVVAMAAVSGFAQEVPVLTFTGPVEEQLAEGKAYDITWQAQGLKSVTVVVQGDLTDHPDGKRGRFNLAVAEAVPAGAGGISWTVPFLDTLRFRLIVKGYDESGQMAAVQEVIYLFRPEVLRSRTEDGIYVDVRREDVQRLYLLRDNRLVKAYLTSGSLHNEYYPTNIHPKKPHDHPGVFRVAGKYPNWYSKAFQVDMPYAMRYHNGHFIHATSQKYYPWLGQAASSGCNRLHLADAKELYAMTPVGTRVEIIAE